MPVAEASSPNFDILSYPQHAANNIVVDAGGYELQALQAREQLVTPSTHYLGGQAVRAAAPELVSQYVSLACSMEHRPSDVMIVSDSVEARDAVLGLGMGMAQVTAEGGVEEALDLLLDPQSQTDQKFYEQPLYSSFSYEDVIRSLCRPGTINVVGFVGRTGAGKSTTINQLLGTLQEMGGQGGKFELDAFFIKSRQERKAWLNEPCLTEEEKAQRGDVVSWWDFDLALETLAKVRGGEPVHLEGLYDMERGGEKVGTLDLEPGNNGYTVFVEGTTLLLPVMCEAIDSFIYLNTHDHTRAQALLERNLRHGYSAEESHERKVLTDAAETHNHLARELRLARFTKGRLTVLDNTERGDHLRLLPPFIPEI
jgi:uridine kinase